MSQSNKVRRGKIVNLLLVLMLIVGTIPLVISGYNLISYNANILARDQQLLHLQICKSVASEVSLFLKSSLNILVPLQKSLELNFNPSNPKKVFYQSKTRELINAIFKAHNRILNIRVVFKDARGVEAGYKIDENTPLGKELLNTFYICTKKEFSHVSRPYYSSEFNQVVYVVGKTVLLNNEVEGVITVVFSMNDVYTSIERIYMSGNTVYLLDSAGNIILHPDINVLKKRINISNSPLFKELKKLRSHAISTIPYVDMTSGKPVKMIGTVYMIPETDVAWGVVVQTPERVANIVIQEMERRTVYWILLSVTLALLLSFFFSQRLSNPIQVLTQKTLSITKGNFNERVNIKSRNELGILADNFNLMAEWIENYIQRLKEAAEEYRQLFIGAIRAVAAAIDAKDPYTRGHAERVTFYSLVIAQELGLSPDKIERIQIAALLHDVGKIGIKDEILQKPSMLTDEEFEIMKQHPELGGDIISQIPQLKDVIPGIRYHHESLDGSGYPRGLKGEQIPLSARIIGVADAFDAMTTERPYQKPFSAEAALEIIKKKAGTKFDARVVDAFIRAYKKGKIKLPDQRNIRDRRYIKSS